MGHLAVVLRVISFISLLLVGNSALGITYYRVTVATSGSGSGTVTSTSGGLSGGINCGSTCQDFFYNTVTLVASPAAGSTFLGWSGDCSGTGACTMSMDAPKSVTATFGAGAPVVTYPLTVNYDALVCITINTCPGMGSGTVTSSPAGINCSGSCTGSFTAGTSVVLTATPAVGSNFYGWSGVCGGTGSCVVTMDAAKTVSAIFTAQNTNLLTNPGFEQGSSSWTPDAWDPGNATLSIDSTQSYSGIYSAKIVNTNANDARWVQTVTVQPNTNYRLSGWIKTSNVGHTLESTDRGANLSILDTYTSTNGLFGTNGWTYQSLDFNSGTSTSIRVAARLGMYSGTLTGTAWFDGLSLINLSADTQAPTCPGSFQGVAASTTQVNLSWAAATDNVGVASYRVYRNSSLRATLGTATSYSDTGLSPGSTYSYQVLACDAAGNCSSACSSINVTTPTGIPGRPGRPTLAVISSSQINVSWDDVAGATYYNLFRNGSQIATLMYVADATNHFAATTRTYSDTGLTPATTYTYTVAACNGGGCSGQSDSASGTTSSGNPPMPTTPAVPTGLQATAVSSTQINLSWATAADSGSVANYKVYRNGSLLRTIPYATSFSDTGLASGLYGYNIAACNSSGNCSAQSSPATATTGAPDCLFDWAEGYLPALFAPAGTSATLAPYYYRYYSRSNSYLGISANDGKVYFLDAGGTIHDEGTAAYWYSTSGCR